MLLNPEYTNDIDSAEAASLAVQAAEYARAAANEDAGSSGSGFVSPMRAPIVTAYATLSLAYSALANRKEQP